MPDDLTEPICGVHFATHCYIIPLVFILRSSTPVDTPPMTDVVQNPATTHEHSRTGLSADALRRGVIDHLRYSIGRPAAVATPEHYYRALALAVRDRMQGAGWHRHRHR